MQRFRVSACRGSSSSPVLTYVFVRVYCIENRKMPTRYNLELLNYITFATRIATLLRSSRNPTNIRNPRYRATCSCSCGLSILESPRASSGASRLATLLLHFFAALGLLAPYLERACFLSATPAVSSVPRMMW